MILNSNILFILISTASYSQHKFVLRVKGGIDSSAAKLNLQDVTNNGSSTTQKINVANLNLTNVATYPNQDSAIKHGLIHGDVFKLPADLYGNHLLAIIDTTPSPYLSYVIDNTNGESLPGFQIANSDSLHFDLTVNWGDGTVQHYTSYAGYICLHKYSSYHTFNVTITPTDPSVPNWLAINDNFSGGPNQMTFISNINSLINLKRVYLEWNRLTATLIDTIKLPAGLLDLGLGGNYLGTFDRTDLPSSMIYLDLRYNNLDTIPIDKLPANLTYVSLQNNNFTSSLVNHILIHFDNSGITNGQLFLKNDTPSAPPSGDGLTAKANLIAKGWDVTTD